MRRCLDSLLLGGNEVEIIIVNDGSTDMTAEIADEYAKNYPNIVRVIHQENGGHGSGLNAGIKNAKGLYFKVVDSDDWVDPNAYKEILKLLKKMIKENQKLDLLVSNYVYEKEGARHKKVMHCRRALPKNKILTWDHKNHFSYTQYILMHSAIFRTEVLRKSGLVLPKHTFYVDNIFVYKPLPYTKSFYYLDVDFYRYHIGRDDQSVNEKVMIKRIDQQIKVNKTVIDIYNSSHINNKGLEKYMRHYLDILMGISSVFLTLAGDEASLEKKDDIWDYLKAGNPELYRKIRRTPLGVGVNLPGRTGRGILIIGYRFLQKFIGFN